MHHVFSVPWEKSWNLNRLLSWRLRKMLTEKVVENRNFRRVFVATAQESKTIPQKGFNQLRQSVCGILRNILLPASTENQMEAETTKVTLPFLHNAPF